MWAKAALMIGGALGAGMFLAAATSDSDAGEAIRQDVSAAFAPIANVWASWRDHGSFYGHDDATSAPTSAFDAFLSGDKADPDFAACVASLGPDLTTSMENLAGLHTHAATAGFVDCVLTRNVASFCSPAGRERARAAVEIYYWSRAQGLHPTHARLVAEKMSHLQDDTELGPGEGGDSYERTWDGPQDQAIAADLKLLLRKGYLDADAFGLFPRAEIRATLAQVKREGDACKTAHAG